MLAATKEVSLPASPAGKVFGSYSIIFAKDSVQLGILEGAKWHVFNLA
jgi:hypothetical protein